MLPSWLRSDVAVYVASGVFSVLVFVGVVLVLNLRPGTPGFVSFTVGFLLFVLVYFVSLVVYREIDRRDT